MEKILLVEDEARIRNGSCSWVHNVTYEANRTVRGTKKRKK